MMTGDDFNPSAAYQAHNAVAGMPPVIASLIGASGIVNAALYLAGVFVTGLVLGLDLAWKFALASAGFAYLCAFIQLSRGPYLVSLFLNFIAIIAGILGGVMLLAGG